MREDPRRRGDYALEPVALSLDRAHVAVRSQRGIQRRRELLRGQLGLLLVVVDVVRGDDIVLGRLPGLAGAKHDAHEVVVEFLADAAHEFQSGLLGFHHDVEQHDGDVVIVAQVVEGAARRIDADQVEWAVGEAERTEDEAGDFVDLGIVIDDQHMPWRRCLNGRLRGEHHAVVHRAHAPPGCPESVYSGTVPK